PQLAQGDLDVARTQLDRVIEVAELAPIPHFHGTLVSRAVLSNANTFRVVAVSTKRRSAAGADPLVATLVSFLLLFETFLERLHELVPSAQGFDLRLFLLAEDSLAQAFQPVLWQACDQHFEHVL